MRALRWVGKWLLRLLLLVALSFASYVMYAHLAWPDIPAVELDAKYGGPDLKTATVDGLPIRYRQEGQGPDLVLIHSHYFDMGMWDTWMPVLTPHFRVLRYDLAGHGLTGPDATGVYTVERDVALLDGLLQQLGIHELALVGSSLGGNIAFTFAAQQPARVRSLVLVSSGGLKRLDKPSRGSGRSIPGWADHIMPLIPPMALRKFVHWMSGGNEAVTASLAPRFIDLWRREGNRVAELARLRQFETGDPDPLLAGITAPSLILWGEQNPQLPVALSEQFAAKLTSARSVQRKTYPGAAHLLPAEQPQASADDALAFLLAQQPSTAPAPTP